MSSVSRRTVLRGVGAAMALPWLESLPVLAAPTSAFPKRFAVLFMGNGISGNHWWAKGAGAKMTLGRSLAPLEPLKPKITVINGLFNQPSFGNGIHPAQTGNLLSGAPLFPGAIGQGAFLERGAGVEGAVRASPGISVDQLLAAHLGRETPRASLVLSCEPPLTGRHESDYSLAYSSH